jgi:hypothetical protein
VLLPLLGLAVACGTVKPVDGDGGTGSGAGAGGSVLITISGTAAPLPLNATLGGPADDFSMLKIAIVEPAKVVIDPNATPLGSAPLDTSPGNCDTTMSCRWTLPGVDISRLTLDLVGTLEDMRTGADRVWVETNTGMGTDSDLDAWRAARAPVTDRRAFAVSRKLEAALAAFASKAWGKPFAPGDLEATGFLIGHVVGRPSEGPMPAGVAGVTVSTLGDFTVAYPSADFQSAGTATSSTGIFLAIPDKPGAMVALWDVVPPSTETRSWQSRFAGTTPNSAFVIVLPADE